VEFHHVVPYAADGRPTVENIQLRCRAHNSYEAEAFYGPDREYVGTAMAREAAMAPERVRRDASSSRNETRAILADEAALRSRPAPLPPSDG